MKEHGYDELMLTAKRTEQNAYVPYSNKANGAALLASDGRIFTGCTVEIANFSGSVCAAQAALINAVTDGARSFTAIAVTGNGADASFLCGSCRQCLAEFGLDTVVISEKHPGKTIVLRELLPSPFTSKNLLKT